MHDRLATWCILVTALAGCGGGNGVDPTPRPRSIGTLAYVVSECHEDATGFSGRQSLQIRRGDLPPVTVAEMPTLRLEYDDPAVPPFCSIFGAYRFGTSSVDGNPLQRLAVSPDGSSVVFEVTFEFSIFAKYGVPNPLTPDQEGIFFVRADGSGLRRLGPASREPTFHVPCDLSDSAHVACDLSQSAVQGPTFHFSPSGDRITYADHGPDRAGEQAIQIVTLSLETGERHQVTLLHPHPQSQDPRVFFIGAGPVFLDEETIEFATQAPQDTAQDYVLYTVKADQQTEKEDLVPLPPPVAVKGSMFAPDFLITGAARSVYQLLLPDHSWELFQSNGDNLIQLTHFGRGDTATDAVLSRDRQRVLFSASGDPCKTNPNAAPCNPYENCQLFSVDTLGGHLQQLTRFNEGEPSMGGCQNIMPRPSGCFAGIFGHDRHTDTIVFDSSCDPLGTNPDGDQIFAMEFDGTGLRQLTHTHRLEIADDGTVSAELPGPAAYPGGP